MPTAYLARGSILLDLGRYDEAIADLAKSTERDPCHERSRFKLSEAYRGIGKEALSGTHRQRGDTIPGDRVRIGE